MTFYVAAPWQLKRQAGILRDELLALKLPLLSCTADWLDEPEDSQASRMLAEKDLSHLGRSDLMVLLNPSEYHSTGTGGRHVECGYALALKIPILLVGAKTNIFHELELVEVMTSEGHLFDRIADMYKQAYC